MLDIVGFVRNYLMKYLKNKKILFGIITAFILLIGIGSNYYFRDAYASRIYYANSTNVSDRLQSGDVIEQEFTLAEGDEGVQVFFGTYVTVLSGGQIQAELFDSYGAKVAETVVDLTGTQDNTYTSFHFGKLDESLYNQRCKIRLTFSDIDDQFLAYYTAWTDGITACSYNGEVQDHNLVVNGIKATQYLEYRDFRLNYIMVMAIFMVYVAMFKINWKEFSARKSVENAVSYVKTNWKLALKPAALIIAGMILSYLAELYLSRDAEYANPFRAFAIFTAFFIIAIAVAYKKYIWQRAHIFFFVVSMLVGSVYIASVPPVAVGWDEQLHYTNSSYMSLGATNKILVPDYLIETRYVQQHYYNIFQKVQREAWVEEINEFDRVGGVMGYLVGAPLSSTAYIPTSIVLYVTRVLGLDFTTRFTLGRWFNLLLYSLFNAMAIKLLRGRGKMIVAAVSLLPTQIVMAGSYGYDWWLNSLVILGYAVFISELQGKGMVSTKKTMQAVIITCLGLTAKAVYFPLLLPFFLLKKDKQENAKKARVLVLIGVLILVASFVLPLLMSAATGVVADNRGHSNVDAMGQIVYILNNMDEFLSMLYRFMMNYLNPDSSNRYITLLGYQGSGGYYTVCLLLMGVAATVDNSETTVFTKKQTLAKIGGYIGVLGSLLLVVTALYVGFTDVGDSSVSGCQPRYILTVLFPFLFFFGENAMKVPSETKAKVYSWVVIGISLVTLLAIHDCYIVQY